MKNRSLRFILFPVILSIFIGCVAEAEKNSSDSTVRYQYLPADEVGPWRVGHTTFEFSEEEFGREIEVDVWYPTYSNSASDAVYLYFLEGVAVEEADLAEGGPYPLIIFSHGHGSISVQNYNDAEFLASHGYIIAAPNHTGNSALSEDPDILHLMAEIRPKDVSKTIDQMLAGKFGEHINENAIGAWGHSFGGYTTIAVSGAAANDKRYRDICIDRPGDLICSILGPLPGEPEAVSFGDRRIKAGAPMSPAGYDFWGADGLANIKTPLMIVSGTIDKVTPHEEEAAKIYAALTGPKILATFENANHYSFTVMCQAAAGAPDMCPENRMDGELLTAGLQRSLASFFGYYLKGIDKYREYFQAGAVAEVPGLSLQVELTP